MFDIAVAAAPRGQRFEAQRDNRRRNHRLQGRAAANEFAGGDESGSGGHGELVVVERAAVASPQRCGGDGRPRPHLKVQDINLGGWG